MKSKTSMPRYPVISLFTGSGGLDLGAHLARCASLVCVEIDEDCVSTLSQNREFARSQVISTDLREVSSEEILSSAKLKRGEAALLIGGPPCQPFSKAAYWTSTGEEARRREQLPSRSRGLRKSRSVKQFNRKKFNPREDPRSSLIDEYVRVLNDLRPSGFVFENVMSIRHPKSLPVFEGFLHRCRRAGYSVTVFEANAAEFGVPQLRRRVFVTGLRGKLAPTPPAATHRVNGTGVQSLPLAVTAGEAISNFSSPKLAEPGEVIQGRYASQLREIPPGWNYKALSAWAGHPKPIFEAESRYWHFLLKLHPDKPSWTIAASPGPWTGPFHWDTRRLRVPELAALQSFPSTFEFAGSRRSIQRQIGNAVPPLLAKAVVSGLVKQIAGKSD
jgi:DNA (cytosine-5)-methyltransferase 1